MIESILSQYPIDCRPSSVCDLGNGGGFSGAHLWKLESPRGVLCLRQWPATHPTADRLTYIHQVMKLSKQRGCQFIPVPITTEKGETFILASDQRLWELTPWMPGRPMLAPEENPGNKTKLLRVAMQCLARFHQAVDVGEFTTIGVSQGFVTRLEMSERLLRGELAQLHKSIERLASNDPFRDHLRQIGELAAPQVQDLPALLSAQAGSRFRLQPCLRDIWCDHVLFENNEVTGLVDFGAVRQESIAADIARLLGSVQNQVEDPWQTGITAYEETRSLSAAERDAIPDFHRTAVVLSGLNWIRWLAVERRTFENGEGVLRRLNAITESLRFGDLAM